MSKGNMTVEMSGEKTFGPCACCGEMTTRVWGFVYTMVKLMLHILLNGPGA